MTEIASAPEKTMELFVRSPGYTGLMGLGVNVEPADPAIVTALDVMSQSGAADTAHNAAYRPRGNYMHRACLQYGVSTPAGAVAAAIRAGHLRLEREPMEWRPVTSLHRTEFLKYLAASLTLSQIIQITGWTTEEANALAEDTARFLDADMNGPAMVREGYRRGFLDWDSDDSSSSITFGITCDMERRRALSSIQLALLEGKSLGLRRKEAAGIRGVSEETEKTHMRQIMKKLHAPSPVEAVTKAIVLEDIPITPRGTRPELTLEELRAAVMVALGHTNPQIGARLRKGRNDIRYVLKKLCTKVDAKNKAMLGRRLFELGVFEKVVYFVTDPPSADS